MKNKNNNLFFFGKISVVTLVSLLFLFGCSVPEEKSCQVDSDCVIASCCHATDAVNDKFSPNCQGVACTLECQDNTFDCGQAEIKCVKNECKLMVK